jgi:hypothetical protein
MVFECGCSHCGYGGVEMVVAACESTRLVVTSATHIDDVE